MSSEATTNIKGPDAFQAKFIEFFAKVAQNPKPLLAGLGIILAAAAVGYGVSLFIGKKQENRRIELSKIDVVFDEEIKALSQQREALEKKRADLQAAAAPGANPAAGTPAETPELKALSEQIEKLKPDHKKSAALYKEFYNKYPTSPEGMLAGIRYAAYAAGEEKNFDEAQKVLEPIAAESQKQKHSILEAQSSMLLISIFEDKGELDKALAQADKLLSSAVAELKPSVLLSKAQIQFMKKDFANAQTTLNQLLSEHANSMEAERAKNLLALVPQG